MKKFFLASLCLWASFVALAQKGQENFEKARIFLEKEDYKNALKWIDLAIQDDPNQVDFYNSKGLILKNLERYQDAFEVWSFGITQFPDDPFVYYNRGVLLLEAGDFEYANKDFTSAIEKTKNDTLISSFLQNRAVTYSRVQEFQKAYDDLILAHELDQTNIGILVNLGGVCDEVGKGEETLKFLKMALALDSTYLPIYGNIGYKYQEMGDYQTAISYYNKVISLDPNEPLGYSNRAYNYYKLGRLDLALQDINKSIKMYPTNSYAYRVRALIHIAENRTNLACEDLQKALDLNFTLSYGDEVIGLKKQYCGK